MRCFEALGSGSLLLSDEGNYPEGMRDGQTIATYSSPDHAVRQIRRLLEASPGQIEYRACGPRNGIDRLLTASRRW
jgi:spore maturation protein CgeB